MRVNRNEQVAYHEICRMFVVDEAKVFLLSELHTSFQHHMMAHQVTGKGKSLLCLYSSFARHGVLHLKHKGDKVYLVEKDSADLDLCS